MVRLLSLVVVCFVFGCSPSPEVKQEAEPVEAAVPDDTQGAALLGDDT